MAKKWTKKALRTIKGIYAKKSPKKAESKKAHRMSRNLCPEMTILMPFFLTPCLFLTRCLFWHGAFFLTEITYFVQKMPFFDKKRKFCSKNALFWCGAFFWHGALFWQKFENRLSKKGTAGVYWERKMMNNVNTKHLYYLDVV